MGKFAPFMSSIQKNTNGMNKSPWYKTTIVSYAKEHETKVVSGVLALLLCSFISAQIFIFKHAFMWVEITPISDLPWNRMLFSALTYVSLGAILYYLLFYKFLSFIFYRVLGDYKAYLQAKRIVWAVLMLINYYYVAPFLISILNKILSFTYNGITLLLFISPSLGGVFLCLTGYFLVRKFLLKNKTF